MWFRQGVTWRRMSSLLWQVYRFNSGGFEAGPTFKAGGSFCRTMVTLLMAPRATHITWCHTSVTPSVVALTIQNGKTNKGEALALNQIAWQLGSSCGAQPALAALV